ncbi:MAG: GNAT family N-acetyltransferase [Verrucomicrobiota bacterium]
MSYRIIRSFDGIGSLEQEWQALLSDGAAPFSSYSWNVEWLRAFRTLCDEILVFAFYDGDGAITAIFPLYRKEKQIRFIGDGCSHHQDIVVREAEAAEWGWRVVIGYVRSEGCSMIIPKVSSGSFIAEVVMLSLADAPMLVEHQSLGYSQCFRVASGMKGDAPKPFEEPAGVELRVKEGRGIMDGEIEKVADLHGRQFRERDDVSLFENDVFRRFVRKVARRDDAGARLLTLGVGKELAAFILGFSRGGTFYVYASGIDEGHRDWAPDRYLWRAMVRLFREEPGVSLIDVSCSPDVMVSDLADAEYELFAITLRQRTAFNRLFSRSVGFLPPVLRKDALAADYGRGYERAEK